MTVTYSAKVATTGYWTFLRLLLRWRGSIYKLVWFEFAAFCVAYATLSLIYRFLLTGVHRQRFEHICLYCDQFSNLIPVAFILGFYVSMVVSRWWDQFMAIPWPDEIALLSTAYISGTHERAIIMRRTIVRYLNLALAITFRSISSQAHARFPTEQTLVTSGLMTVEELQLFNEIDSRFNKFYVPVAWAVSVTIRAFQEKLIRLEPYMNMIIEECANFRHQLRILFCYDWVNPPLVYTQVATIAVYTYFFTSLFGRQFLDPSKLYKGHDVDFYVPVFALLQICFYMGWLKVAEALINPFGNDDDDFDVVQLIQRNLQVSYVIVDEKYHEHPEMVKDPYWDTNDLQLPYTEDTKPDARPKYFFTGSLANLGSKWSMTAPFLRGERPHGNSPEGSKLFA